MINRGVKGITLDPANAMALVPIVKKAHDAGRSDHQHLAATAGGGGGGLRDRQFPGRDSDRPVGEGDDGIEACAYRAARLRSFGFGVSEGDPQIAGSALNMGNAETGQTAMEDTFYPPIRTSTSSARSTSLRRKAPTSRSRKPSAMCSSPRSTAATPASTASPTARSARLSCNPRPRGPDAGRGDRQGGQGRSEAKRLPQYRHGSHHGPPGSGRRLEGLQMGLETAGAHDGAGSRTSRELGRVLSREG
jgi:hypothetical protein